MRYIPTSIFCVALAAGLATACGPELALDDAHAEGAAPGAAQEGDPWDPFDVFGDAELVTGSMLCAPCDNDGQCGEGFCTAAKVCEKTFGYCAQATRGNRDPERIDMIVIHTMEGSYEGAARYFARANGVSAHYLVDGGGRVGALISEHTIGKHGGNTAVDGRSIGIELEGFVAEPGASYTDEMYGAAAALVRHLAAEYEIPLDRDHIIGHQEISDPNQSAEACGGFSHHGDPGPGFDWLYFMSLVQAGEGERTAQPRPRLLPLIEAIHVPDQVRPLEQFDVSIVLTNEGSLVWERDWFRLETSPEARESDLFLPGAWLLNFRPRIEGNECTGPQQTTEVTFRARAPYTSVAREVVESFHFELWTRDRSLLSAPAFDIPINVVP